MITVIFGDNLKESRLFLSSLTKGKQVTNYTPEKVDATALSQSLSSTELFVSSTVVVLENYLSQIKSKEKEAILKLIKELEGENEIIFWDNKMLNKPAYALFSNATVRQFKLPQTLFQFLDSLKPGNSDISIRLHQSSLKGVEPEMLFFMLIRHFRLLLSTYFLDYPIEEQKRMQSWQSGKLATQAKFFGKEKLIKHYRELWKIEQKQKVGALPYPLSTAIDFFIAAI